MGRSTCSSFRRPFNFGRSRRSSTMNITFVDLLILLLVFLAALYYYGTRTYDHFKKFGVKYMEPSFPFVGSIASLFLQKEHFKDLQTRFYNAYKDQKYVGVFEGRSPLIFIRDLELLKQISIRDFNNFHDHQGAINEEMDSLFGNTLTALQGDKWKVMRAMLSSVFTSTKLKNMFPLIKECAEDFTKYLVEQSEMTSDKMVEIETKDTFMRYLNDAIATTAFGLKMNTLKDKDHEFYKIAKESTDFTGLKMLKISVYYFFPMIFKCFKMRIIPENCASYLRNIILETMSDRHKTRVVRHDLIDAFIKVKNGSLEYEKGDNSVETEFAAVEEFLSVVLKKWTDDELIAQAFLFLFAGMEVTGTHLEFFFYEMAQNGDIQKKLQKEIDDFLTGFDENWSYQEIGQLKYLDMTVCESLRKWPPTIVTDRVCTDDFVLPPPNDNSTRTYKIRKGENVWIPIWAFHHDPDFYPEPEKFDPERFSDENKPRMRKLPYLPFGIGPRNCIGTKYALMVSKIVIIQMLSKFDVVVTDNTQTSIVFSKTSNRLIPEKPLRIGFKLRNNKN